MSCLLHWKADQPRGDVDRVRDASGWAGLGWRGDRFLSRSRRAGRGEGIMQWRMSWRSWSFTVCCTFWAMITHRPAREREMRSLEQRVLSAVQGRSEQGIGAMTSQVFYRKFSRNMSIAKAIKALLLQEGFCQIHNSSFGIVFLTIMVKFYLLVSKLSSISKR